MPNFGDADLPVFFADFGVPCFFNGQSAQGIFDRPLEDKVAEQGWGGITTALPKVRIPYNGFSPAMPRSNDTIVVNGTDYTIVDRTTEEDGAVIGYSLKVLSPS